MVSNAKTPIRVKKQNAYGQLGVKRSEVRILSPRLAEVVTEHDVTPSAFFFARATSQRLSTFCLREGYPMDGSSFASDHPDWNAIQTDFMHQPDRGAAIIGAALVEDVFASYLSRFFPKRRKKLHSLFDQQQALGTHGSRTDVAFSLGLIDDDLFDDMNSIRKIRNQFAHTTRSTDKADQSSVLTFESQRIRSLAMGLKFPEVKVRPEQLKREFFLDPGPPTEDGLAKQNFTRPRNRFVWTCNNLFLMFYSAQQVDCRIRMLIRRSSDGSIGVARPIGYWMMTDGDCQSSP